MAEIEHLKKAAETLAATHMDIRTREPADDIGWFAREMVAPLKELETVRAQRDALRAALEDVNARLNAYTPQYYAKDAVLSRIAATVTAALNTQPPQAEWTPRKGDTVRVKTTAPGRHHQLCVVISEIRDYSDHAHVKFEDGEIIMIWLRDLEPAPVDESEAE